MCGQPWAVIERSWPWVTIERPPWDGLFRPQSPAGAAESRLWRSAHIFSWSVWEPLVRYDLCERCLRLSPCECGLQGVNLDWAACDVITWEHRIPRSGPGSDDGILSGPARIVNWLVLSLCQPFPPNCLPEHCANVLRRARNHHRGACYHGRDRLAQTSHTVLTSPRGSYLTYSYRS
jgi:hypothetical protein